MLKVSGIFSTGEIKKTNNGTKYLKMCNQDKDNQGNISKNYYTLWLTDKASNIFDNALKKKIADNGALINLEGFLLVSRNNNYTNMTIFPSKVSEYNKQK